MVTVSCRGAYSCKHDNLNCDQHQQHMKQHRVRGTTGGDYRGLTESAQLPNHNAYIPISRQLRQCHFLCGYFMYAGSSSPLESLSSLSVSTAFVFLDCLSLLAVPLLHTLARSSCDIYDTACPYGSICHLHGWCLHSDGTFVSTLSSSRDVWLRCQTPPLRGSCGLPWTPRFHSSRLVDRWAQF